MPLFECLSEEKEGDRALRGPAEEMEVSPTQRMMSACAGVLATSIVVTPMGECLICLGKPRFGRDKRERERKKKERASPRVSRDAACAC